MTGYFYNWYDFFFNSIHITQVYCSLYDLLIGWLTSLLHYFHNFIHIWLAEYKMTSQLIFYHHWWHHRMNFQYGCLTQFLNLIMIYVSDLLNSQLIGCPIFIIIIIILPSLFFSYLWQLWGADERRRRLKLLVELGRADMAAEGFVLSQVKSWEVI